MMTILITYDNNHNISKEWYINKEKLEYFGLYKDFENEIDFENEHIKLSNITDDNFAIIYKLLFFNNREVIENIEKYDNSTILAIYKITDCLIMKNLQNIIGDILATRLNKMNITELQNIIELF
jgi:hypothetical protein